MINTIKVDKMIITRCGWLKPSLLAVRFALATFAHFVGLSRYFSCKSILLQFLFKLRFLQVNVYLYRAHVCKCSKLPSICYIFANAKCAWVLNFAQDQSWPDHFCSRSFRQQLLQEKFGFSCSCIKCRWGSPRSCVHQTLFYPADVSSTYRSILGYLCKSYLTRVFNHLLTPFHQSCCRYSD